MALRNISNELGQIARTRKLNQINNDNQNSEIASSSFESSITTSSASSSIKIRTSSPISSASSSQNDLVNLPPFYPTHISRKQANKASSSPKLYQKLAKLPSMKDLAYEKLRKQQQFQPQSSIEKKMFRSNGKLKIGVYNNFGHLTINIVKGRDYKLYGSHQSIHTDTYVKINMLPDQEKRFTQYQTMVVKTIINPNNKKLDSIKYDEKYSFEVDKNDYNNRIIISVWSRGLAHTTNYSSLLLSSSSSTSGSSSISTSSLNNNYKNFQDSLIGCFSFRVKTIMSNKTKLDSEWFHLLPESFGLNKHLRCRTTSKKTSKKEYEIEKITNVNKDLIGLEKLSFKMVRPSELESFGFTITGNCPCMIGKVDLNKTGFNAGLRPGDYLSSVNGKNVSRATTESVVKLIKSCKGVLEIEVHREKESILNYMTQTSKMNLNQKVQVQQTNQLAQLESVPEEEEFDNENDELSVSSLSDESREDERFNLVPDSIRHVDSDISEDDKVNRFNSDAENLRKVASKYFTANSHSANHNQQPQHQNHFKQANILSLRNLRINNGETQTNLHLMHPQSHISLPNFNQFI